MAPSQASKEFYRSLTTDEIVLGLQLFAVGLSTGEAETHPEFNHIAVGIINEAADRLEELHGRHNSVPKKENDVAEWLTRIGKSRG